MPTLSGIGQPSFFKKKINNKQIFRWQDVTEERLEVGLRAVLDNKKYQEAVTQLSDLVMDQPQHPLERATWWMEYLLRHPGNVAMRSPVHDLAWHQYFLLDVILVLLVGAGAVVWVAVALVRCCCCRQHKQKYKKQ